MSLAFAYLAFFLVGPLIFLRLTRAEPSRHRVVMGSVAVVGLMLAAWILKAQTWQSDLVALVWLACLWLGWIATVATGVQAVRLRVRVPGARKWSAAAGAVATVVPWFGLTLAMGTAG